MRGEGWDLHVVVVVGTAFFGDEQFVLFGGVTIPIGYLSGQ